MSVSFTRTRLSLSTTQPPVYRPYTPNEPSHTIRILYPYTLSVCSIRCRTRSRRTRFNDGYQPDCNIAHGLENDKFLLLLANTITDKLSSTLQILSYFYLLAIGVCQYFIRYVIKETASRSTYKQVSCLSTVLVS